jgi:AraC-like DNA-binding protein
MWRLSRPHHPGLAQYLHERAAYVGAPGAGYTVRLVPTGQVTMVVNLGVPYARVARLGARYADSGPIGSLVSGLDDGPGVCEHPGGQESIRMQLTPLGAYRLFAMPQSELANTSLELRDVLGAEADELAERAAATSSWSRRFDLIDAALLARIHGGPEPAPQVVHAWRSVTMRPGAVPIARIAEEVGWSRRHLARRFTQQVGLTPKTMERVARFQQAVAMLSRPGADLAEISAACGFYDQAHLSLDFRDLAGASPRWCASASWAVEDAIHLP